MTGLVRYAGCRAVALVPDGATCREQAFVFHRMGTAQAWAEVAGQVSNTGHKLVDRAIQRFVAVR
jgi:hypothetical protein